MNDLQLNELINQTREIKSALNNIQIEKISDQLISIQKLLVNLGEKNFTDFAYNSFSNFAGDLLSFIIIFIAYDYWRKKKETAEAIELREKESKEIQRKNEFERLHNYSRLLKEIHLDIEKILFPANQFRSRTIEDLLLLINLASRQTPITLHDHYLNNIQQIYNELFDLQRSLIESNTQSQANYAITLNPISSKFNRMSMQVLFNDEARF